ncbi:hypothetical protein GJ744_008782 [Endocarpon pusillum]|uniref:Uncharacterized protein n=1 Tax=Endocarpon pusillum TaxID=364733 RepID=A0A8H7AQI2_9EURO|nr:hypothetical protein GJ744_008782 [Endocarpon pusillum]
MTGLAHRDREGDELQRGSGRGWSKIQGSNGLAVQPCSTAFSGAHPLLTPFNLLIWLSQLAMNQHSSKPHPQKAILFSLDGKELHGGTGGKNQGNGDGYQRSQTNALPFLHGFDQSPLRERGRWLITTLSSINVDVFRRIQL